MQITAESQRLNPTELANEDHGTDENVKGSAATGRSNRSRQCLRAVIDDAFLMLSHAADRGVPLEADIISKIVDADAAERTGTLTHQQECDFWLAASAASKAILPVTPDSLRCSVVFGKESAADQAAKKYRLRTLVTLFALLVFQVYWLIGATIVADIDSIKARLTTLSTEFNAADRAMAQLNPQSATYAAEQKDAQARANAVYERIWVERISIATDFAVLKNWNVVNRLLL